MPNSSENTVCAFTLRDIQEAREELVKQILPQLRALCESRGVPWGEEKLRWGAHGAAAVDQQSMEICRGEIDRCQQAGTEPNFIVPLRGHLGRRPLPERIEAWGVGEGPRSIMVTTA
jgi:hypothetical protein